LNIDGQTIKLTPEQEASINYRGGALLVSAAAGSGKTKVLVERLLSLVDEGANIDEFLVITYTRAAALELRERIYEELLKRLGKSPGNSRLRRQAMLCKGASIDTIHTFCLEILRENAHLARLPPDFRVADESESAMIMNEVADNVLGEIYERLEDNPGFTSLIDTVADKRDDKLLVEALLTLYSKLQSSPDPDAWIEKEIEKQKSFAYIDDISKTDFGEYMLKKLKRAILYCQTELIGLRYAMKQYPEFEVKYAESVDGTIEQINPLLSALDLGWDEARLYSCIEIPRPKPIKGYEKLKENRLRSIKELKKCIQELEYSSEEHIKDAKDISFAITALLQLLVSFGIAYTEEKRKRGVADFSDLEHLTLSLLIDKETGAKTELARNLSLRFKEIMIDEYQDVNAVQEYIFNAISKDAENIFMVGDVKQSIYRFRLADPSIFLSKYSTFDEFEINSSESIAAKGTKIHLSRNFRSHGGILRVVNHIFHNIMSKEFGELEYTEKERLVPGKADEKGKQGKQGKEGTRSADEEVSVPDAGETEEKSTPVEVDILDMSTFEAEEDEDSPTSIRVEAQYIAQKVKRLVSGRYMIPKDDGGERPLDYSDIVILLRSTKGRAWQYASALTEEDIPIEFPGGEGYFETPEVTAALSLLTVVDNPIQDIPLASVMSGFIYGFTTDELAELRTRAQTDTFYNAIKKSAEDETSSEETCLKCKKMLSDINALRLLSMDMPSDRFIWHMYNRTGLLDSVSRMQGGEKRKNNLILLAESARQFEKNGYKGVFGFLRFINNLQERGIELSAGTDNKGSSTESSNSVKIMSVHKSKGLEFPVVILANSSKLNNFQDIWKNVVFHTGLGLGAMLTDKKRRIRYTTLARTAIQSKLSDEMLSEELRVLYVAMTRAKDKLIITGALKNTEQTLDKLAAIPEGVVAPQAVLTLRSMIEWILVGIRGYESTDLSINFLDADAIESEAASAAAATPIIKHSLVNESDFISVNDNRSFGNLGINPILNSEYDLRFETDTNTYTNAEIGFFYPYRNAVDLPSKLTVTGLKTIHDPEAEQATWVQAPPKSEVKKERLLYPAPSFILGKREMTAADRGILLHLVMQHIDYKKWSQEPNKESVEKELQRLKSIGLIADELGKEVDIDKLEKFLSSSLGGRMISAKKLEREFKFSILRPAENYFPGGGDDKILLQGVVDCYFEENDEIVVVDFKTDKVTEKTIEKIAKQYSQQLNTYADALHHITGKRVKERIIYFFAMDHVYTLK
jgi:ATP-dependent helicase/nuclease subunit A